MNEKSIIKLHESLKQLNWVKPKQPNSFEVLKITTRETIHSEFLAWLLNPLGSHHLNDRFLKRFISILNDLQQDDTTRITIDSFNQISIQREQHHTDITILDPSAKVVIVIENKIYSTQGVDQLKRYREQTSKQYPGYQKKYVFLTLYYEKAQDDGWIHMSYQHILDILKDIQTKCPKPSMDLKIIKDYIHLFGKELRMEKKLLNQCLDIYRANRDAIELVLKAREENITAYYEEIRKLIDTQVNLKFVQEDRANHKFNFVTQFQQDHVFKVDKKDNKFGNDYGFMYEVQKTDQGFQVIGTLGSDKTDVLLKLKQYAISTSTLVPGKDDLAGWAIVFKSNIMIIREDDLLASVDENIALLKGNLKAVLDEIDLFENNFKDFYMNSNR